MINFTSLTKFVPYSGAINPGNQTCHPKQLNTDCVSFSGKTKQSSSVIELVDAATQSFFPDYLELNLKLIIGKFNLPNSLNQKIKELSDDKLVDIILTEVTKNQKKPVSIEEARELNDQDKVNILKTSVKRSRDIKIIKNHLENLYNQSMRSKTLAILTNLLNQDNVKADINFLENTSCSENDGQKRSLLSLVIYKLEETSKGEAIHSFEDLKSSISLEEKARILNDLLGDAGANINQKLTTIINNLTFNGENYEKINDMSKALYRIAGSENIPAFLNRQAKRSDSSSKETKPIIDFVIEQLKLSEHQKTTLERLNSFCKDKKYSYEDTKASLDHYKILLIKKHIKSNDKIKYIAGILTGTNNKLLSPLIMSELKDLRKFKDRDYNKLDTVIDKQGQKVIDYIINKLNEDRLITEITLNTDDYTIKDENHTLLAKLLKQDKDKQYDEINHQETFIYKVVNYALEAMSIGLANGTIS